MDVINQYAFGQDDNYLMEPDFKASWEKTLKGAGRSFGFIRQFPFVLSLVRVLPLRVLALLQPRLVLMVEWQIAARKKIDVLLKTTGSTSTAEKTKPRSLFEAMRDSKLPPHEKSAGRFFDEAQTWIGAGTETVAQALSTITCHILSNKDKLGSLKRVLKEAMPTPTDHLPISTLEQIPYLAAVISEGLRVSNGLTTRLPRLARADEPMVYQDWEIPFGTPVSATAYFSLQSPAIFPEPEKFQPERWLLPNGEFNKGLLKYLVNFGRGTRQCLGMNLAYGELYLTISSIFRRFEMELFETTTDDVKTVHDFFVAAPGLQSQGVHVTITGEAKE
ncbi:cytochrome P450 [Ophiocordyceps sinensis CO18]|uniref:Cytochrome P450 n=1 Tax=Ophiocordyceps sinensis (strain Co18 / CGMCC 3.14243) TaxID=911162 RepID=T5ABL2_OPHSC|nr:cytochrome P450 [Ophiocordyceps sinensis CO18]